MKVLMLGWEFPPFFAGGVGIVCSELTKALQKYNDLKISYVMPYGPNEKQITSKLKILSANNSKILSNLNMTIKKIPSTLYAYDGPQTYSKRFYHLIKHEYKDLLSKNKSIKEIYGENLVEEVYLYAQRVLNLCVDDDFDVIHAHDWTTFPAALLLKEITGKPLIIHVHITELDKTGGQGGHEQIFGIEREGFLGADKIIVISNFVKNRLVHNYGINPDKMELIYNGGISDLKPELLCPIEKNEGEKLVLFAGRMTLQKGPEYFLRAAKIVLDHIDGVKFAVIGGGDMLEEMMGLAHHLGIEDRIYFHGPYSREDADKFFGLADVFVMPSVSEPFGIVPLEAMAKGTPTIVSKQSGISEVLEHTFKVDFWDTEEMANKIISLVKYPTLHKEMSCNAFQDFDKFSWDKPAEEVYNLYREVTLK